MKKIFLFVFLLTNINSFAQNVGIGTAFPTNTLDVNGSVRIRGGNPTNGQVLTTDPSGNATWQDLPASPTSTNINKTEGYSSAIRNVEVIDSSFQITITQSGNYFYTFEALPFPQSKTNGCTITNYDESGQAVLYNLTLNIPVSQPAGLYSWDITSTPSSCQAAYKVPILYTRSGIQFLSAGTVLSVQFLMNTLNTTTALSNWIFQTRVQMIRLN